MRDAVPECFAMVHEWILKTRLSVKWFVSRLTTHKTVIYEQTSILDRATITIVARDIGSRFVLRDIPTDEPERFARDCFVRSRHAASRTRSHCPTCRCRPGVGRNGIDCKSLAIAFDSSLLRLCGHRLCNRDLSDWKRLRTRVACSVLRAFDRLGHRGSSKSFRTSDLVVHGEPNANVDDETSMPVAMTPRANGCNGTFAMPVFARGESFTVTLRFASTSDRHSCNYIAMITCLKLDT